MAAQDTGQDPEAKSNSDVLDSACAHLKRLPQRALGFNYEIVLYIWGRTERFGHRFNGTVCMYKTDKEDGGPGFRALNLF